MRIQIDPQASAYIKEQGGQVTVSAPQPGVG